jgi:lipopolysaccharide transport system permease protein
VLDHRRFRHTLDLLLVLTQKELKVRYKSSVLGYLWSIAQPLALALIFFTVFKIIMRVPMQDYALFLITGLFPWQCFSNSVNTSSTVFLANASIIKKVKFPRHLTLLAVILQDLLHLLVALPVVVAFLLADHRTPAWSWLYGLPILLTLQFLLTYGLSLAVASLNLFFRDMERLVALFIMMAFYATPVLYQTSMVPEAYRWMLIVNPLAPLITGWRNLLLDGTLDGSSLAVGFLFASALFLGGNGIYRKLSGRFAEVL